MQTLVAEVPDFFKVYEEILSHSAYRDSDWRLGQYIFNRLYDIHPDVADQIRGSLLDPFYWDDVEWAGNQEMFWDRVMDLWEI